MEKEDKILEERDTIRISIFSADRKYVWTHNACELIEVVSWSPGKCFLWELTTLFLEQLLLV